MEANKFKENDYKIRQLNELYSGVGHLDTLDWYQAPDTTHPTLTINEEDSDVDQTVDYEAYEEWENDEIHSEIDRKMRLVPETLKALEEVKNQDTVIDILKKVTNIESYKTEYNVKGDDLYEKTFKKSRKDIKSELKDAKKGGSSAPFERRLDAINDLKAVIVGLSTYALGQDDSFRIDYLDKPFQTDNEWPYRKHVPRISYSGGPSGRYYDIALFPESTKYIKSVFEQLIREAVKEAIRPLKAENVALANDVLEASEAHDDEISR